MAVADVQPERHGDDDRLRQLLLVRHVVPAVHPGAAGGVDRGAQGGAAAAAAFRAERPAGEQRGGGVARPDRPAGGEGMRKTEGTLGVFNALDATTRTIERLRSAGFRGMTVY